MSKGMSPLPSPFIPEEGACIPPFRCELWGINTHGSGAFNTSELLLHSSPLIIDELFFPSYTTLRSIENNLIRVFPPSLILPHFFLSNVASLWYKTIGGKRGVGGRCRGGAAELGLKYAFFTEWRKCFFKWENYTQIYTCSVSFFRLEQFFSLLWETQNHSCVFSAWCAD